MELDSETRQRLAGNTITVALLSGDRTVGGLSIEMLGEGFAERCCDVLVLPTCGEITEVARPDGCWPLHAAKHGALHELVSSSIVLPAPAGAQVARRET